LKERDKKEGAGWGIRPAGASRREYAYRNKRDAFIRILLARIRLWRTFFVRNRGSAFYSFYAWSQLSNWRFKEGEMEEKLPYYEDRQQESWDDYNNLVSQRDALHKQCLEQSVTINKANERIKVLEDAAACGLSALKIASRQLTEDMKLVLNGKRWGGSDIDRLEKSLGIKNSAIAPFDK
jgi:hypothetical protein